MALARGGTTTLGKYATNANAVQIHVFPPRKTYK
jgi:hypothetical protein